MDIHWESKKRLSAGITNPQIDAWYELAKKNGAIGGKISGAGGGGFLMFYCEEKKPQVRDAMRKCGLRELNFRFEFEGSKVIFDAVSRDGRLALLCVSLAVGSRYLKHCHTLGGDGLSGKLHAISARLAIGGSRK
jgi:hypothetical protein